MKKTARGFILLAVAAMATLGTYVWAEEPDQDEMAAQIKELQQEVAELKTATSTTESAQEDSWLSRAMAKVDIHGYVAQGYLYSTDNNYLYSNTKDGSFQFNEATLNFFAQVSENVSVAIQLVSRDLGAIGNNAIQLDYAFGDYHLSDEFGLRAGRIRIPWGLYGEYRDVDAGRTSIFMPHAMYSETQRDVAYGMIGFGGYGRLSLGGGGTLDYRLQVGSNNIDDQNTAIGWVSFGSAYTEPGWTSDHGTILAGQLIWETPLDGLRVAGSYFGMDETTFTGRTSHDPFLVEDQNIPAGSTYTMTLTDVVWWIASAEYATGNLVLAAEYVGFENTLEDSIWVELGFPKSTTKGDGYYLSGSYRFSDLFELGAYYSAYWPNKNDRNGDSNAAWGRPDYTAWNKDFTLSLRFDIHKHVIWKVEAHLMDGTANLYSNFNDLATAEENAILFATKLSYRF